MLGIGGKFASSRGMATVPDISGLSRTDAKTAIAAAGLVFSSESSSSNSVGSSKNGLVKTQSISAGTLAEYDTSMSFTYYESYVPPVYLVKTVDSSSSSTSLTYTGYGGATYSSCVNGSKTKTTYRFYDEKTVTTYYTTYYYSDGSTSKVETGTSESVTPIEIASDTTVSC